jgi:hypothetical protein
LTLKRDPKIVQTVKIDERPDIYRQDTALDNVQVDEDGVMYIVLNTPMTEAQEQLTCKLLRLQMGDRFADYRIRYRTNNVQ